MHCSGGRRPSVLAVMTMNIDWPRQLTDRFGQPKHLVSRNAIITEGNVNVAQAELPCCGDIGPGTINREDRLDAEFLEGTKAFVPLWTAAAIQVARDAEDIV